ncbi:glycosyltransferase family 4 protein [Sphingobacterium hotanense]|uniref:glycosyltransferase family 4 protein n=1 Tax=Sphingobacterium hotanense TaxID=649196 RepID=UPI0011F11A85|nr:glycosyltransferase family 4 protein [Sphingobacterium hotanense]
MSKVVFFDFLYNLGGAQKSTVDLLLNLSRNGDRAVFLDAHGECKDISSAVNEAGLEYKIVKPSLNSRIGKGNKIQTIFKILDYLPVYLKLILKLGLELKNTKPDLVLANSSKGIMSLIILKHFYKIEIVFFIRGDGAIENKGSLSIFLINKYCKFIVTQSESMKKKAHSKGFLSDKLRVIPNIINTRHLNEEKNLFFNKDSCLNILLPATVIKEKGIVEAIKAMAVLKEKGLAVNLIVAGSIIQHTMYSEFNNYLIRLVEELSLKENVQFLGYRNDIVGIMKGVDIVLLPSYKEGMPRVIMEAMYLSKAVVGSDVGAVSDLIISGKTGILIKPKSINEIVDSISLLNDAELRRQMGTNAKSLIDLHYTEEVQYSKFLTLMI